ncbi:hypothetical protein F2P81_023779 [Xyrichtys novacula]|uniref:Uncharacterized protein n=1 Tax=Xyrichtys novacula TaxID=13765 RepID=A0AAV1GTV6_XYRNO|nr:hypothetical protein F2P81_023779 [Xyrichtys novacula]
MQEEEEEEEEDEQGEERKTSACNLLPQHCSSDVVWHLVHKVNQIHTLPSYIFGKGGSQERQRSRQTGREGGRQKGPLQRAKPDPEAPQAKSFQKEEEEEVCSGQKLPAALFCQHDDCTEPSYHSPVITNRVKVTK